MGLPGRKPQSIAGGNLGNLLGTQILTGYGIAPIAAWIASNRRTKNFSSAAGLCERRLCSDLGKQALEKLIARKEQVLVAVLEAVEPAVRRGGDEGLLRDGFDRNLDRRCLCNVDDLVTSNPVASDRDIEVPVDIADLKSAGAWRLGWRCWHGRRTTASGLVCLQFQ
jgi:hypothetical protein